MKHKRLYTAFYYLDYPALLLYKYIHISADPLERDTLPYTTTAYVKLFSRIQFTCRIVPQVLMVTHVAMLIVQINTTKISYNTYELLIPANKQLNAVYDTVNFILLTNNFT